MDRPVASGTSTADIYVVPGARIMQRGRPHCCQKRDSQQNRQNTITAAFELLQAVGAKARKAANTVKLLIRCKRAQNYLKTSGHSDALNSNGEDGQQC